MIHRILLELIPYDLLALSSSCLVTSAIWALSSCFRKQPTKATKTYGLRIALYLVNVRNKLFCFSDSNYYCLDFQLPMFHQLNRASCVFCAQKSCYLDNELVADFSFSISSCLFLTSVLQFKRFLPLFGWSCLNLLK